MSWIREVVMRVVGAARQATGRANVDKPRAELEAQVAMHTGLPVVESVVTDLRYALRSLRAKPGYTTAVLLTLGLGIGANSGMFAIINAVVLRPLPYPDPARIIAPSLSMKGKDTEVVDDRVFFAWTEGATSATFAAHAPTSGVATLGTGPEELRGMQVTAPYFGVLGVRPLLGRVFTRDEDRPDAPNVVLLAERLWRRGFGADSAIIGRSIDMDGRPTTVIGVLPASFAPPGHPEYWRPYGLTAPEDGSTFFYQVIGRVRGGTSLGAVRTELATITARADAARATKDRGLAPIVMTLHDRLYGERRTPLLLLFGAVGVLLLIACANLANLALARSRSRHREFAVRAALGASRWRLVRYLLCESLLLSFAGAVLGLLLATATVQYFTTLSPAAVGNVQGIRVDAPVVAFTLLIAVGTAAMFGLIPSLAAGREDLHRALSAGGPRGGETRRQQLAGRALVVAQLSTALVLLTAAGLVARTFARVVAIDPGFRADGLVSATFRLPSPRYSDETAEPFYSAVLSRVRNVPGVESAALVDAPPLAGVRMSVSKRDSLGRDGPHVDIVAVGDAYFRTIGSRILEGRAIDETDHSGASRVAVVNATLARTFFPGTTAIGQSLPFYHGATVVGVVADVLQRDLEASSRPIAYVPTTQEGFNTYMRVLARTSGPIPSLELALRQIVRSLDGALPPPAVLRMDEALADQRAPRKFTFLLLGLFAGLAAMLAVVGLYGVLAHIVADRTREIGIRAALGADQARVVGMIVRQASTLVVAGSAIGLIGAGAMTRVVGSLLFGVSPTDPATFVCVTAGLVAVAMLAAVVPAWRAARVDPVIALRSE